MSDRSVTGFPRFQQYPTLVFFPSAMAAFFEDFNGLHQKYAKLAKKYLTFLVPFFETLLIWLPC